MRSGSKKFKTAGFTMIELLVVLHVIAVVAAVAIVHSGNVSSQTRLFAQVEVIKNHICYAQMMAMKSNVSWGIDFSSNSSYTLQTNGATSTVYFPGVSSATYTLPAGVTVSASASPVVFDTWGNPGASNITVTVTSGTTNTVITVNMITGAVQ
jgi:prepilin-type N-terminal cleavage/methylation domain-containing protein